MCLLSLPIIYNHSINHINAVNHTMMTNIDVYQPEHMSKSVWVKLDVLTELYCDK